MIKGLAQDYIAWKDQARICTQVCELPACVPAFPFTSDSTSKWGQLMTGWLSLGHKESRHSAAVLWLMAHRDMDFVVPHRLSFVTVTLVVIANCPFSVNTF